MSSRAAESTADAGEGAARGDGSRPGSLFARPVFWIVAIGALWLVPLIKSLGREFPDPVPGHDRAPSSFELSTDQNEPFALSNLAGYLAVVQPLPLAERHSTERAFERLNALRKRLRGLGFSVVFVMLAETELAQALAKAVDARKVRRPTVVFLVDPQGATMESLLRASEQPGAEALLVDRHGRVRGAYGPAEEELDRLVGDTGMLANWAGSDPEVGQPVTF